VSGQPGNAGVSPVRFGVQPEAILIPVRDARGLVTPERSTPL